MTAMLSIQGLTVRYGASVAVENASFTVEKGSLTSLIGSNGAGKTTMLKAISGLVPSSAGSIDFLGKPVLPMAAEQRAVVGIAHVLEGRHVFPNMTVLENLQLGAFIRSSAKEINADIAYVEDMFPRLRDRRRQLAGTLSGGEQQMLAIGRALMSRPQLLMMDEPTMGLSPQMIEFIIEIIARLHTEGLTLLLVEQNAVEAIQMADRVFAIRHGEIIHDGPGSEFDMEFLKAFYLANEA